MTRLLALMLLFSGCRSAPAARVSPETERSPRPSAPTALTPAARVSPEPERSPRPSAPTALTTLFIARGDCELVPLACVLPDGQLSKDCPVADTVELTWLSAARSDRLTRTRVRDLDAYCNRLEPGAQNGYHASDCPSTLAISTGGNMVRRVLPAHAVPLSRDVRARIRALVSAHRPPGWRPNELPTTGEALVGLMDGDDIEDVVLQIWTPGEPGARPLIVFLAGRGSSGDELVATSAESLVGAFDLDQDGRPEIVYTDAAFAEPNVTMRAVHLVEVGSNDRAHRYRECQP